jgi:hypothetical protein
MNGENFPVVQKGKLCDGIAGWCPDCWAPARKRQERLISIFSWRLPEKDRWKRGQEKHGASLME